MKKISIILTTVLIVLMGLNINFALNDSNISLQSVILKAFGNDETGETLSCDVYDDCYTGKGCRCYKSTYMYCPECRNEVYMCNYTGNTSNHCGWFELTMQGGKKQHKTGCSKEPSVH